MRSHCPRSPASRAFTLIELLVVIAIVGVLMGLLLPAAQKVREAANKIKCVNNLRQFGVAMHAYHNDRATLPPGGRILEADWNAVNFGADKGSWLFYCLPYLEQHRLYDQVSGSLNAVGVNSITNPPFPSKVPFQFCPSDSPSTPTSFHSDTLGGTSYAASAGPQCWSSPSGCWYAPFDKYCRPEQTNPNWKWGYTNSTDNGSTYDLSQIRGPFNRTGVKIRFKNISDGLSNTILCGETLASYHKDIAFVNNWAAGQVQMCTTIIPINYGPIDPMSSCANLPGGTGPGMIQGMTGMPLSQTGASGNPAHSLDNWGISDGFKSNHPGGANFLMGDGSIRFLSQRILPETYNKLGCRNDGKPFPHDPND